MSEEPSDLRPAAPLLPSGPDWSRLLKVLGADDADMDPAADFEVAAVWEPDRRIGLDFQTELAGALDQTVCRLTHGTCADDRTERVSLVAGQLGTLAVRSAMGHYAGGEEGAMAEFLVVQCESVAAAQRLARAWGEREVMDHLEHTLTECERMLCAIDDVDASALRSRLLGLAGTRLA